MSPLACLLFVFAAMVATAHSECQTKHVGRRTSYPVDFQPIYFYPPGVEIHVDQNYCPPGMRVVGEDIKVCNNDRDRPPPEIDGPYNGKFSPFTVRCSVEECSNGGNVHLTQYCAYY